MGGGHAGKTLLSRFLPTESYAIAVPVTLAVAFFGGMLTRIFVSDPEMTGVSMSERDVFPDQQKHSEQGEAFRQHIRTIFQGGSTTIFNNAVVPK